MLPLVSFLAEVRHSVPKSRRAEEGNKEDKFSSLLLFYAGNTAAHAHVLPEEQPHSATAPQDISEPTCRASYLAVIVLHWTLVSTRARPCSCAVKSRSGCSSATVRLPDYSSLAVGRSGRSSNKLISEGMALRLRPGCLSGQPYLGLACRTPLLRWQSCRGSAALRLRSRCVLSSGRGSQVCRAEGNIEPRVAGTLKLAEFPAFPQQEPPPPFPAPKGEHVSAPDPLRTCSALRRQQAAGGDAAGRGLRPVERGVAGGARPVGGAQGLTVNSIP